MVTARGTTVPRQRIGDAPPHRWLAIFVLVVSLSGGALGWADDEERHPLDPLSREEIGAVVEILTKAGKVGPDTRFALIALQEPPKTVAAGAGEARQASVVAYERTANRTIEGLVNLTHRHVISWKTRPGVQPPILMEEYALTAEIVRADSRWRAAMQRRGILDFENVALDPWPIGPEARSPRRGARMVGVVAYYKGPSPNPYARPIEGVIAYVDLNARRVVRVLDGPAIPVPPATRGNDLDEASVDRQRPMPTPLEIRQPDGPSFERRGHLVRWQNWQFRFAVHPREGLVLYTVAYEDDGRLRSILYRASLSELFVPYADRTPTWSFRNAFDQGEIDLGRYANSLEPGTDVPAHAAFYDATLADDHGRAYEIPRAVALYERDGGLLWKHVDYPRANESRRGRELVLGWIANQGNYEYGFNWVFHQDGTLEMEALLIGIVLPKVVAGGRPVDDDHPPHGRMVAPHIEGVHHQHWFNFRLDMDVDGPANAVLEVNVAPASSRTVTAARVTETLIGREGHAARRLDPGASRFWKIVNAGSRNVLGQPVAYVLEPGENSSPFLLPGSPLLARAGFLRAHLWITAYDPTQQYAAGQFVNQGPGGDGLPRWVQANRSLVNRDVVLWYTMGITHIPRPEDWPVMSVHRAGFRLVPTGFFSRNPALDVPRPR